MKLKATPFSKAPLTTVKRIRSGAKTTAQVQHGVSSEEDAQEGSDESSSNLTDRAYAIVRRMILHRELSGGEVLVEGRLAERLQMSRTPLREALLRLEGEG